MYTVVITSSDTEGRIPKGSEIAAFDQDRCVGSIVFDGEFPAVLPVWMGNEKFNLSGASAGRNIILKSYDPVSGKTSELSAEFSQGGQYGQDIYSAAKIVCSVSSNPVKYALNQNYPNPFNPSTKIKYSLPSASKVRLEIFNILGEKVAELVNREMQAGNYEADFNAASLSSGTYIYRLQTQGYTESRKMLLLK
jgi:hypothetical protein